MAGDKQEAPWPIPMFHFKVKLGDVGEISFQEVSGLDSEYDVIEYRAGDSNDFSVVKMPGLKKVTDVSLKKGMFKGDSALFDYFSKPLMNTIARETVTISLLDEGHNEIFVWTLNNAFPKKITGTTMNAKNSEAAVEEIVLAYEGLKMEKK